MQESIFSPNWDRQTLATLFHDAHTERSFEAGEVDRAVIEGVYEAIRWAPTAYNSSALRISVVASEEAREKLVADVAEGNRAFVAAAPMVLLLSWDEDFPAGMVEMGAPQDLADSLLGQDALALQSATMQASYLILGLRAAGLHVGPMTGANFSAIRKDLLADTSWQPFMVLVVGANPTDEGRRPRKGRLSPNDVIKDL